MSKGIHDLPLSYDLTYGHEMQIRVHASEGVDVSSYIPVGKGLMIDLVNEARFNSISHLERESKLLDGCVIICRVSYGVQRVDIYPPTTEEGEEAPPDFICTPRSSSEAPYGWVLRDGEWVAAEGRTEEALFGGYRVFDSAGNVIKYEIRPIEGAVVDDVFKSRWRAGNVTWTSADGKVLISWMNGIRGRCGGISSVRYLDGSDATGEIYMNGEVVVEPVLTAGGNEVAPVIGACVLDGHIVFGVRETDQYYNQQYYSIYKQKIVGAQNPELIGRQTESGEDWQTSRYFYGLIFSGDGSKAFLHHIRYNYIYDELTREGHYWDYFRTYTWAITLDAATVSLGQTSLPPYFRTTYDRYQESTGSYSAAMYSSSGGSASNGTVVVDMGMSPDGNILTRTVASDYTVPSGGGTITASLASSHTGECGEYDFTSEQDYDWSSGDSYYSSTQCCDGASGNDYYIAQSSPYSYSGGGSINIETRVLWDLNDDLQCSLVASGSYSAGSSSSWKEEWQYDCAPYGDVYTSTTASATNNSATASLKLSTQVGDVIIASGGDSVSTTGGGVSTITSAEGVVIPSPSTGYYALWKANRWLSYSDDYYEWNTIHELGVFYLRDELMSISEYKIDDTIDMDQPIGLTVSSGVFTSSSVEMPEINGSYMRMDGQIFYSFICGAMYNKSTDSESNLVTPIQGLNHVLGESDLSLIDAGGLPVIDADDSSIAFIFQVTPDGT